MILIYEEFIRRLVNSFLIVYSARYFVVVYEICKKNIR